MNRQLERHIKDGTTISAATEQELFALIRHFPLVSLRIVYSGRRWYATTVTWAGPAVARRLEARARA